jgi:hypothetical protein
MRNSHESSEIVKRRISLIVWSTFEVDHRPLHMGDHFTQHREHLFANLCTFYTTVLHFLRSYFGRKPHIFQDELPRHSYFGAKKADNSANFAAGGINNRMTHHNSL